MKWIKQNLIAITVTCILSFTIAWVIYLAVQAWAMLSLDQKLGAWDNLEQRIEILEEQHKNLVKALNIP